MLLAPVPRTHPVWALPVLTVVAPSERYYAKRGRQHQPLTERARQVLQVLHRWLPDREQVVVADSRFAALELLAALPDQLNSVTRLRLDAALYEPAPVRQAGQTGRPRRKGKRLPTLEQVAADPNPRWNSITLPRWYGQTDRTVEITRGRAVWSHPGKPVVAIRWVLVRDPPGKFEPPALLGTDREAAPEASLGWFVQRWQVEVTFQEGRAPLGVETQRQWSDQAIARTTLIRFGLFSLVTRLAHRLQTQQSVALRTNAWYPKRQPTVSDALARVRSQLWRPRRFSLSVKTTEVVKVPAALWDPLTETLCYAA